ncbi:MAG: hypothetical protein HQ492_02885, partial [Woeseiaceae bacterium]|nr:hypothetical protein [Woeseiaceae bacterium]
MAKFDMTGKARVLAASALLAIVLSACGQTTNWLKGRSGSDSDQPDIVGAPEIDRYISEMAQIAGGDPAAQAEIYADAAAAAELTPSASTNLRFGLVLSIPGHSESNPELAQSILRDVLAQTMLLTPAEVSLAIIHLNYVEREIVANFETNRLRASTSRAAQSQEQA